MNHHILPITNLEYIKKFVPHRAPMLLLDTLYACDESSAVCGLKVSSKSIAVLQGALSETGLLEHMAQCVALHSGYSSYSEGTAARVGYIGAIKQAEIVTLPRIDDSIVTEVNVIYSAMEMTLVSITSKVENAKIATAEMSTILKQQ